MDSKIIRMMTRYRTGIAKTAIMGTQEIMKMQSVRRKDTILKNVKKEEDEYSFENEPSDKDDQKDDDLSNKRVN